MSDLQCPATFLVVGWGPVPHRTEGVEAALREGRGRLPGLDGVAEPDGVVELAELADELRDRRIAAVCSGGDATALAAATALARRLGVTHRSVDGLDPLPAAAEDPAVRAGPPGTGPSAARHRAALDALADLHRGETVLVVTDASVVTTLWPAGRGPDDEDGLSPYRLVTVQVDGDGWRLLGRAGGG